MIDFVEPLPSGNALRLYISPPAGARSWRVLRRTDAAAFTGPDDAGAVKVADRTRDNVILDDRALVNGTTYAYRAFYANGLGAWIAQDDTTGTPAATYASSSSDPQTLLRDRLALGLAVEVQRGKLQPTSGKIQVVTAPFALVDAISFPCVSVHHDSDASSNYAVGDAIGLEQSASGIGWDVTEGWLSRFSLNVTAASLSGDERIQLRLAIQRVVVSNLPVFYDHGLRNIDFAMRDHEEQGGSNNASLFMCIGSFGCTAPCFSVSTEAEIAAVNVTAFTEIPHG